mmetsp:Transcript_16227/g.29174  ORF Transcript_16227/g.29174 Transcript_16227/m.29174 type:complete len:262 (-) Transcript_16227:193-978(-)
MDSETHGSFTSSVPMRREIGFDMGLSARASPPVMRQRAASDTAGLRPLRWLGGESFNSRGSGDDELMVAVGSPPCRRRFDFKAQETIFLGDATSSQPQLSTQLYPQAASSLMGRGMGSPPLGSASFEAEIDRDVRPRAASADSAPVELRPTEAQPHQALGIGAALGEHKKLRKSCAAPTRDGSSSMGQMHYRRLKLRYFQNLSSKSGGCVTRLSDGTLHLSKERARLHHRSKPVPIERRITAPAPSYTSDASEKQHFSWNY